MNVNLRAMTPFSMKNRGRESYSPDSIHMTTFANFDAHRWLASHTSIAGFKTEELHPVMWFMLIWNRFEYGLFNRDASLAEIDDNVSNASDSGLLSWEDFDDCWTQLKGCLVNLGVLCRLEYFLLSEPRPGEERGGKAREREKQRVAALLPIFESDLRPDIKTALKGMLFIAYRIRNNLFHGEKCITSLPKQRDLFMTLNFIITKYIDISKPPKIAPESV
jgi:hypothetical protein